MSGNVIRAVQTDAPIDATALTFDAAREFSEHNTQVVDRGLGPIGLHIENGDTPVCPDIVAFFSTEAAFEGSQTTI